MSKRRSGSGRGQMIGATSKHEPMKSCEAVDPERLFWVCPYSGVEFRNGGWLCVHHAQYHHRPLPHEYPGSR